MVLWRIAASVAFFVYACFSSNCSKVLIVSCIFSAVARPPSRAAISFDCWNLDEPNFVSPPKLDTLDDEVFRNCKSLVEVEVPECCAEIIRQSERAEEEQYAWNAENAK